MNIVFDPCELRDQLPAYGPCDHRRTRAIIRILRIATSIGCMRPISIIGKMSDDDFIRRTMPDPIHKIICVKEGNIDAVEDSTIIGCSGECDVVIR